MKKESEAVSSRGDGKGSCSQMKSPTGGALYGASPPSRCRADPTVDAREMRGARPIFVGDFVRLGRRCSRSSCPGRARRWPGRHARVAAGPRCSSRRAPASKAPPRRASQAAGPPCSRRRSPSRASCRRAALHLPALDRPASSFSRSSAASCFYSEVEENSVFIPFIIVSPAGHVEFVRNCLIENDYFGLDTQKVWVLEGMELPIVSIYSKKILLKSPWEILQKPAGSGAIFSLLSSNKILDTLNEMGVEFVQICSLSNRPIIGHPLPFGAVSSRGADVGIKLCKTSNKMAHRDLIHT